MVTGVTNIFVGFHGINNDQGLKIFFAIAFTTLLITLFVLEGRMRRENAIPKTIVDQPPVFQVDKR